jgi:two-component system, LytTR family, sensor kinase
VATRGITDLFLPRKIAYHVKIITGSVLATACFNLLRGGDIYNPEFIQIFFLLFIQFEIYIWLGERFFNISRKSSTGEYLRKVIIRLAIYYLIVLLISSVIIILYTYLIHIIHGWPAENVMAGIVKNQSKGFIAGFTGGVLFGTMVFFYFQWLDALKREQKLREEKLKFQYETLKNQVRPHFLFNSLNTLSSMVPDNTSAEKFIQKLSGIYRYMLDNVEKDFVGLEEEIRFAADYFSLQQIRDEEKIRLEQQEFPAGEYNILPISLQILIENALKHNSATREVPLIVRISMDENEYIVVRNNIQRKMNLERSNGMGLKNLGERVKLATGRDLVIEEGRDFIVKVPLIKL